MTDINSEVKNPLTQAPTDTSLITAMDLLDEINDLQCFMSSCAIAGLLEDGVDILSDLLSRQSKLLFVVRTVVQHNLNPS